MSRSAERPYRGRDHGTFEEEWGPHKGVSEWWYVTGHLEAEDGRMFSYQYTTMRVRVMGLQPYIVMLVLTDFQTGRHLYAQKVKLSRIGVEIRPDLLRFADEARLEKGLSSMRLRVAQRDYALDLELSYGKGPVWHCDGGVLRMGSADTEETTLYYSYTNMPTKGSLTLDGKVLAVKGRSWFDRQGGPYALMERRTHWEWFSLRFFDDEEMMLFTFPQNRYQDGTYVPRDGAARRLTEYSVKARDFITVQGSRYSSGWDLEVPGLKEERYAIRPLLQAQVNLGYLEQLCGVFDPRGNRVGLCFAELLPGVWNEKFKRSLLRRAG